MNAKRPRYRQINERLDPFRRRGSLSLGTYGSGVWQRQLPNPLAGVNNQTAPDGFMLSQNYPNPFNPVTNIRFDIPPPKGDRGRMVRVIIYDLLGREVATLVNEHLNPGTYEVSWDGSNYPSGVYYYKLVTDSFTETRKMVLIK